MGRRALRAGVSVRLRGIGLNTVPAAIALAALVSASCGRPPEEVEPVDRATANLAVTHYETWPAGGTRLTVRITDQAGFPVAGLDSDQIRVTAAGGNLAINSAAEVTSLSPGHLALVLGPIPDDAAREQTLAALLEFVAQRPLEERIGVFRWDDSLVQLQSFTNHRPSLERALHIGLSLVNAGQLTDADELLRQASEVVREIGGPRQRGLRAVVVVGGGLEKTAPLHPVSPLVVWAISNVAEETREAIGPGRLVAIEDHEDQLAAMRAVSNRIDDMTLRGHVTVGVCASPAGQAIQVTAEGFPDSLAVDLLPSLPEESEGECDSTAILGQEPELFDTIAFTFTDEQRAIYDERVAAESKQDFNLFINAGRGTIPAVAHLRGKGSMGCERKSYTINLPGDRPRRWISQSATDEFYLLSICLDDRYVRQHTVLSTWQRLGIFAPRFRYVLLNLDGEPRGIYLLVEKVAESLRQQNSGVASVLRRGFAPPDTTVEVKWSRDGDAAASDQYFQLLEGFDGLSGPALEAEIAGRIDLNQYLTWLASNAALHNGDYVDEVWLVGVDRVSDDGGISTHYSFAGWDPDDIFSDCHYDGRFSTEDPTGLVYCAESEWDHAILPDSRIHELFVDKLEELLDGLLSQEAFEADLQLTADAVLPLIERPEVAAAMVNLIASNPAAADPEVASSEVRAALDWLAEQFALSRERLLEQIANYRAGL